MMFVAAQKCVVWSKVNQEFMYNTFDSPVFFSVDKILWFDFEYDGDDNIIGVRFSFEDDGRKQRDDDAAVVYYSYGDRSIGIFKELAKYK